MVRDHQNCYIWPESKCTFDAYIGQCNAIGFVCIGISLQSVQCTVITQWDVRYVMYKLHNNGITVKAIYMHNAMFYAHNEVSVWKCFLNQY